MSVLKDGLEVVIYGRGRRLCFLWFRSLFFRKRGKGN